MNFKGFKLWGWSEISSSDEAILSDHGAVKVEDYKDYHVSNGDMFSLAEQYPIGANSHHHFLFIPSSGEEFHLDAYGIVISDGPAEVVLYEAPFYDVNSLGAPVTNIHNRNRNSTKVMSASLHLDPFIDVNSLGTHLDHSLQPASGGGVSKGSGDAGQGLQMVLSDQKAYLFRVVNSGALAAMQMDIVGHKEVV